MATTKVRPDAARNLVSVGGAARWCAGVAWAALAVLLILQACAYYFKLPLSLGPRVILQPWLLTHGFVLYETAVDVHTPLMPLSIAALSLLVPDGLRLAKLLLVGLVSLTGLLTFLSAKRHAGLVGAFWAFFCFGVWSPIFEFRKLWHETFLTPIYLFLFLAYRPNAPHRKLGNLIVLGLLGGVSVLIKQHAAAVFLAFIAWNAFTGWHQKRPKGWVLRETVVMVACSALPLLGYAIYQAATAGSLQGFLYWTVGYELQGFYQTLAAQAPTLRQLLVLAAYLALVPPVVACLWQSKRAGDGKWRVLAWGLILMVASSVTVYPRFEFFHLQGMLPILAVLSSVALVRFARPGGASGLVRLVTALAVFVLWAVAAGAVYRPALERAGSRQIHEYSPLLPVANEIGRRVGPRDGIYIFPDDETVSNLYYLLRCQPPHFWVFHYPWYMIPAVKERILHVLAEDPPRWVVYRPNRCHIQASAPEIVAYIQGHYREVAKIRSAPDEASLLERLSR